MFMVTRSGRKIHLTTGMFFKELEDRYNIRLKYSAPHYLVNFLEEDYVDIVEYIIYGDKIPQLFEILYGF